MKIYLFVLLTKENGEREGGEKKKKKKKTAKAPNGYELRKVRMEDFFLIFESPNRTNLKVLVIWNDNNVNKSQLPLCGHQKKQ